MNNKQRDYEHEANVASTALRRVIYALQTGKMTVNDEQIARYIDGAATILGIDEADMKAFTEWQKGLER